LNHLPLLSDITIRQSRQSMSTSGIAQALTKAAECEQRARLCKNPDLRDFFLRWRDSWLAAAAAVPAQHWTNASATGQTPGTKDAA
jgi:hypothetical protein